MEGAVNVVCGHKRGRFILPSCNIEFEDGGLLREVAPPAFEKLSGRACAKKWKESIRIENSDGSQGYTIGRWLHEAGITVPSSRQAHGGGAAGYTGSSTHAAATQVKLTMQEVDDHIQQIGLSMGDPTAAAEAGQGKLAAAKPPQLAAGGQEREAEGVAEERSEVDVGALPMHELSYMAEATTPCHGCSAAAPRVCGVLHSTVAVLSGRPPSLHTRAQGKARRELDTAMASYLEGQMDCYPHEMVGEGPPPMLDGRELDLRHLHRLVQERGGHRAVRKMDRGAKHELWAAAASALGCPPDKHLGAAELVGQLYTNMLRRAAEASAKETGASLPACSCG